jgi:hypothetical protein
MYYYPAASSRAATILQAPPVRRFYVGQAGSLRRVVNPPGRARARGRNPNSESRRASAVPAPLWRRGAPILAHLSAAPHLPALPIPRSRAPLANSRPQPQSPPQSLGRSPHSSVTRAASNPKLAHCPDSGRRAALFLKHENVPSPRGAIPQRHRATRSGVRFAHPARRLPASPRYQPQGSVWGQFPSGRLLAGNGGRSAVHGLLVIQRGP